MGQFKLAKQSARFGIATLMLLVALSAVAVSAYMRISEKRAKLERVRASYAAKADSNAGFRKSYETSLKEEPRALRRDWLAERVRYYGDLERKYAKAASAPWEVVEPDLPRPSFLPTDEQMETWGSLKSQAELDKEFEEAIRKNDNFMIKPYRYRKLSDLMPPSKGVRP